MARAYHRRRADFPEFPLPLAHALSDAVARVVSDHEEAQGCLSQVFGDGSAAVLALRQRVDALQQARGDHRDEASRVHQLATWLAAVAEVLEGENDYAADVHVLLDSIMQGCEFIASATAAAA